MNAFGHLLRYGSSSHEFYPTREDGQLVQRCLLCGHTVAVLGQAVIRDGPAHRAEPDLGAVTTKAKVVEIGPIRRIR